MHRSILRPFVAAFFCAIASAPLAFSQGETGHLRGAEKLDVALSYSVDRYDEFWLGGTTVKNADAGFGDIERHGYNVYAAYGVTDDLDLVFNASWVVATAENVFGRESDLQDGTLRAKWRVFEEAAGPGSFRLLLAPGIKAPLSDYEDNSVTAIGDGQTDYLGRVILHYQTDSGYFASVETGYDHRAGLPDDEFPLNVTVGGSYSGLTVSLFYSMVDSFSDTDIGEGPFPAVEEDYQRVGAGLYYRVNESLGLNASWRTTLDGRNTGDVDSFAIGTVLRF